MRFLWKIWHIHIVVVALIDSERRIVFFYWDMKHTGYVSSLRSPTFSKSQAHTDGQNATGQIQNRSRTKQTNKGNIGYASFLHSLLKSSL